MFLFLFFCNPLLAFFLWIQAEDGREHLRSPSHAESQMSEARSPVPTHPITSLEELEEEESKESFIPCFQCWQSLTFLFFVVLVWSNHS